MVTIELGGTRTDGDQPAGLGSKLGCSCFSLVFLVMGLAFTTFLVRDLLIKSEARSWRPVPCTIERSEGVVKGDGDYAFEVAYAYEVNGHRFVSTAHRAGSDKLDRYRDVQQRVDRYRPGAAARCFVDPAAPERAVLEQATLWMALFLPLPLLFACLGGFGLYATWAWSGVTAKAKNQAASSATTKRGAAIPPLFGLPFFSIFLFAGLGMGYALYLTPLLASRAAKHWPEVPCTVERSWVQEHEGDEGTTYSARVLFTYEWQGRLRRADTLSPVSMSDSDYQGKRELVRAHPRGKALQCRVNPDDPSEAYLRADIGPPWFIGLFALLFAGVGAGGLWWTLSPALARRRENRLADTAGTSAHALSLPSDASEWLPHCRAWCGPALLAPTSQRLVRVLGMAFVAAFWNGIVSVFLWQLARSYSRGSPDYFLTVFLVPFVVIGAGLLLGVIYYLLSLLNPAPSLRVSERTPRLGETIEVSWELGLGVGRIGQLRIALEGTEHATYQRGTTTTTDKEVFARLVVLDTSDSLEMAHGQKRVTIPDRFMHSFEAGHNQITWELVVFGKIPFWPDINDRYAIAVLPATGGEG